MKYQQKGFALLYAILLTGAILSVGVILMNIITKQLLFSSLNRESEATYYYLANSGRECVEKIVENNSLVGLDDDLNAYINSGPVNLNCFDRNDIILSLEGGKTFVARNIEVNGSPDKKVDFSVTVNINCLNEDPSCVQSGKDSYSYFAQVDGYSGSSNRAVRRTAIYAEK